jgi:hypothetical protein
MKTILFAIAGLWTMNALSQGVLYYDQQSSTNEAPPFAGSGITIQAALPYGQTFIPASNAVDFIRLKLNDPNSGNSLGAIMHVNLRTGSISGNILASTSLVTFSNAFAGVATFYFPASVSLTPGDNYVFEPVVDAGDLWNIEAGEYNYPGGTAIYQGSALSGSDVWFREGIIVPEPCSAFLLLLGGTVVLWRRKQTVR